MLTETLKFQKGAVIFREGEESDSAYIVDAGKVEIYRRVERGTVLLAELGPGEILGEMGIIEDRPRSAYAAAAADTVLRRLSRTELAKALRGQPEEVVLIVKTLMERLREANHKVSELINIHAGLQLGKSVEETREVKRVTLLPLSAELKEKMPASGMIISSLPFRVGALPEGEEPNPMDWNNLTLAGADAQGVARNHFAIQRGETGLYVMDRGSKTGTIVNDTPIGGASGVFRCDLKVGDNIVIAGGAESPYRFLLCWE